MLLTRFADMLCSLQPEDIAEAIIDYFENNRQEEFTEGVKKEKEKFSWDKMTASIIEVYNKCVAAKRNKF